jgi:hypothetical protein
LSARQVSPELSTPTPFSTILFGKKTERFGLPVFMLLTSLIPIGMVAYSVLTGRAPAKTEWVRRSERPKEFFFIVILFSCVAAVQIFMSVFLLLHPRR